MGKLKNIFKTDLSYKENIAAFNKIDGFIAIIYYIIFIIAYYITGRILVTKNLYLGIACNLILAGICIILVLVRKQKLSSVGITIHKLKDAVITGSILGILLILFNNILPGVLSGYKLKPLGSILYNIFYYFIIIGFVEELTFRGFIQTRLHGLVKNEIAATTISAFMFSLMHIPFQMAKSGIGCFEFIGKNIIWLLLLAMWHLVFTLLYKKYNSIFTGTMLHGFMDWGSSLFI